MTRFVLAQRLIRSGIYIQVSIYMSLYERSAGCLLALPCEQTGNRHIFTEVITPAFTENLIVERELLT